MKRATIENSEPKVFRVMLGKHEIGVSKTDFDARFHMHAINDALDVAFLEGQQYLERMVVQARQDVEYQSLMMQARAELEQSILEKNLENSGKHVQTSGPQCKKCGAFTTYARVNSHGFCMKCEQEEINHAIDSKS